MRVNKLVWTEESPGSPYWVSGDDHLKFRVGSDCWWLWCEETDWRFDCEGVEAGKEACQLTWDNNYEWFVREERVSTLRYLKEQLEKLDDAQLDGPMNFFLRRRGGYEQAFGGIFMGGKHSEGITPGKMTECLKKDEPYFYLQWELNGNAPNAQG